MTGLLAKLCIGVSAVTVPLSGQAEPGLPLMLNENTLHCHAIDTINRRSEWRIQLDDSTPLAIVDDEDALADYSQGHVRVRLEADGPSLVIGRASGRLVIAAPDGTTLAKGNCTRPVDA